MKTIRCPLCGQGFRVADNVLAAYCNVGHATASYQQGLKAEDGLVYPIGWIAWIAEASAICRKLAIIVAWGTHRLRELQGYYDAKLSPADAVYRLYGVHL